MSSTDTPVLKPLPWKCGNCRERAVTRTVVDYVVHVEHDQNTYKVKVAGLTVFRCGNCGSTVLDDIANRHITEALGDYLGLLPPEQVRRNREALGLTQGQLADALGIADDTVSRWETGVQIQSKALDRLLRLYFAMPEVRERLAEDGRLADLGREILPID